MTINGVLGGIGRDTVRMVLVLLDLALFTFAGVRDWLRLGSLRRRLGFSPVVVQIYYGGIGALPLMSLLGIATGFALTYRLIVLFDVVETESVLDALINLLALELGPLITAVVMISRSGSAITVELATMKLSGEVQSLELLGVNLNHYLVGPRLIGTALAQLSLAVYFTIITLVTGLVMAGLFVSSTYLSYLQTLASSFDPLVLLGFTFKNLFFGMLIAGAACFYGMETDDSANGLARQLRAAIITSLALVFVGDSLFALALW